MLPQQETLTFLLGVLIFWAIIYVISKLLHLERHGLTVYPAYINFKSNHFKKMLRNLSERGKKFWKIFSNLSIALAVGQMIYTIYFLGENLQKFFKPEEVASPVLPILPGLTVRTMWLPYIIFAVAITIILHEAAHGIIAKLEGVSIKSAGAILLLVLPGGFVEPDEKEFERASVTSKLRILSAGSSSNLLCGLLILLLTLTLFNGTPDGVVILETVKGGPLDSAGLCRWDIIYAINGTPIKSVGDLLRYLANVTPREILNISTSKGEKLIMLGASSGNGTEPRLLMLGARTPIMNYYSSRTSLGTTLDVHLYLTLHWSFIILVSVAVLNMLPLYPFDGERFLSCILGKFSGYQRWLQIIINALSLCLIAGNILMSVTRNLVLI
ncbi:TPA: hypothetical protein EYP70_00025 [Candidatus Bathyarchaeota archaeon]|nr:hypothetical protein [Candidatus Bathyarchaeota archaeon]